MKTLTLSLKKQVDMIQEKDMQAPREEMEQMFNRQYSQCKELKEHKDYADIMSEWFMGRKFYVASDVDAVLTELKNEINRKEGVGQRWFERCMEARAENVKLKRALWLARAELCHRLDVDRYLRNHRNSWYNENCLTWAEACVAMEVKMCKAESKCRAKAEEYK